jgi:hypothetical protein
MPDARARSFEHWTDLQRLREVPTGVEYENPLRRRVVYYAAREQFVLYADRCISGKPAALKKVMDAMFLPREGDHLIRLALPLRKIHYRIH